MIWVSFDASGPGQLAIIDEAMNPDLYKNILQDITSNIIHDTKLLGGGMIAQGAGQSSYNPRVSCLILSPL